ncbi:transposase family protein [Spiroplasma poulsonii]|uniref:transposase family protein n=1 Tax=Spiroplasma poulsonii TaxID=2138 RepID=UPI001F4C70E4|nr:transposase family protein [Spiroplasma poulsonii]UNF61859.1 transposase family protein [Spiroplasma poulsonii]
MTLLYWREYQTYFHLGKSFDISGANCYRNIKLNWEIFLIKTLIFNNLLVKSTNKWLFLMIKLLHYWCYRRAQSALKRQETILHSGEKTHDQNTSNYRTTNQKVLQQVFARKKHGMLFI